MFNSHSLAGPATSTQQKSRLDLSSRVDRSNLLMSFSFSKDACHTVLEMARTIREGESDLAHCAHHISGRFYGQIDG